MKSGLSSRKDLLCTSVGRSPPKIIHDFHTTMLISKIDPINYIFKKPGLTGRFARWKMLLSEYDIQYVTQKAIKGGVLSEYLTHLPVEDYQSMRLDFPDEDIMYIIDYEIPGPYEGSKPGS